MLNYYELAGKLTKESSKIFSIDEYKSYLQCIKSLPKESRAGAWVYKQIWIMKKDPNDELRKITALEEEMGVSEDLTSLWLSKENT